MTVTSVLSRLHAFGVGIYLTGREDTQFNAKICVSAGILGRGIFCGFGGFPSPPSGLYKTLTVTYFVIDIIAGQGGI